MQSVLLVIHIDSSVYSATYCGCIQRLLWCVLVITTGGLVESVCSVYNVVAVGMHNYSFIIMWPRPFLGRIEWHGAALPCYSDITV